uniref:alpha-glucosidase n=1 Tax=Acrobeloides nanus TaxID=290746 RepID=A0A914BUM8_9BILA
MADNHSVERGYKKDSYILAVQSNPIHGPSQIEEKRPIRELREPSPLKEESKNGAILTVEELNEYKNDPFWKKLRWILYLLFWLTWILMFVGAIIIIITSPGCAAIATKWWHSAIVYELWTPSFQDSNADGYGDLSGISSRLNQLRKIGVNTVFPRPFIAVDESGLGAVDYTKIHDKIGSLDQAMSFIEELRSKGLKIVIDIPIVATSIDHDWFQRSAKASLPENSDFASYYYWKRNVNPSDYVSEYKNLGIFYFHLQNRSDLAILNWKSPHVSKDIKKALSFWIDKGVDGFHFGHVDFLARSPDGMQPDWPEISRILEDVCEHVNMYRNESIVAAGKDIFLFASPEPLREEHKKLLIYDAKLDGIINTELTKVALQNKICYESEHHVAGCANEILSDLLSFHNEHSDIIPIWQFGNSFVSRVASRVGSRSHAELLALIQLILPGANIFYYGEEIALRDIENIPYPQRGAMPWDDSINSGFSSAPPTTLNAHLQPDYQNINFERQYSDTNGYVKMFKGLARMRQMNNVLISGKTYISKTVDNGFTLCRFDPTTSEKAIIVAVNFGKTSTVQSLADLPPFQKYSHAKTGQVIAINSNPHNYHLRETIDLSHMEIHLGPEEGIVFIVNA